MANIKYDCYSFTDEAEMISVIEGEGYEINGGEPLKIENIITDTDPNPSPVNAASLDLHYNGQIVTNYPITSEEWEPIMSSEVYCISAAAGNFKIPANYKVGGNERKYFWEYTARYLGEAEPV